MITRIKNFFTKLVDRVRELATKKEEPKDSTISEVKSYFIIPNNVNDILQETLSRFSGSMSIQKDIVAMIYLSRDGYDYREVGRIFDVSATTIHRRVKELPKKMHTIYETIKKETDYDDAVILKSMETFFGPKFSLDDSGHIVMIM